MGAMDGRGLVDVRVLGAEVVVGILLGIVELIPGVLFVVGPVAEDVGTGEGALVELVLAVVGTFDDILDGLLVLTIVAVGELVGTPPPILVSVGL